MVLHLSDFLSAGQDVHLQADLQNLPAFPANLLHCLVTGPVRSGKTSILFHFAHSRAAAGERVVFICKRAKVEQVPPLLPAGVNAGHPAFSNIHMRYFETMAELRKYAACFHLLAAPPQALVVDDMSDFLDSRILDRRAQEADLVKTPDGGAPGSACALVVSDTSPADAPHAVYLFRRWLPLILAIKRAPRMSDPSSRMPAEAMVAARQQQSHWFSHDHAHGAARQAGEFELALLRASGEAHDLAPGCLAQLHFSRRTAR